MKHLNPEIIPYLEKSVEERVEFIRRSTFIWYAQATSVLEKFNDLVTYPKSTRMQNYLLVGEPNSGKSSILNEFQAQHPVRNIPDVGPQLDVFTFQAPVKADESRLYSAILEGLNIAHNDSDVASNKLKQVKGIIRSLNLKVIVIDELHNIAPATAAAQKGFLTIIKFLMNELKICMICAGISEVRDIITYDRQLTSRFEQIELESWKIKPAEFIAFLKGYEGRLPLKQYSNLAQREISSLIFKLGEGLIGEYCAILKKAAVEALRSGDEKITIETIKKINFIPPSQRSL